jgi:hypothetical protein
MVKPVRNPESFQRRIDHVVKVPESKDDLRIGESGQQQMGPVGVQDGLK